MVDDYIKSCCDSIKELCDKVLPYVKGLCVLSDVLVQEYSRRVANLRSEREGKSDSEASKLDEEIFFNKVCIGLCRNPVKNTLVTKIFEPISLAS